MMNINKVDKRGSKNNENKDGSKEGNNNEEKTELHTNKYSSDDSYAEKYRLKMEAVEKFKRRQDKILKNLLIDREENEPKIRKEEMKDESGKVGSESEERQGPHNVKGGKNEEGRII